MRGRPTRAHRHQPNGSRGSCKHHRLTRKHLFVSGARGCRIARAGVDSLHRALPRGGSGRLVPEVDAAVWSGDGLPARRQTAHRSHLGRAWRRDQCADYADAAPRCAAPHPARRADCLRDGQPVDGGHHRLAWPAITSDPGRGAAGSAAYLVGVFGPAFIEVVLARLRSSNGGSPYA